MKPPIWKGTVSPKDLPYLIKGVRYTLGYSLCDLERVGLPTGVVGNWECGICGPGKDNWGKVKELIERCDKSIEELIRIGKLDFSKLANEILQELDIPKSSFIRFITSTISNLSGEEKLNEFLDGKFGLAPKNKAKFIFLYDLVKECDDPRKVIFEFQNHFLFNDKERLKLLILISEEYLGKEKVLKNEVGVKHISRVSKWVHGTSSIPDYIFSKMKKKYHKTLKKIEREIKKSSSIVHKQWERASSYPEILKLSYRRNKFENYVFSIFDKIFSDLVKNPIVSDKNFKYVTEIDMCGKINDKTVFIQCKSGKIRRIINRRRRIIKKAELIKKYIEPDEVLLVISGDLPNKKIFQREEIAVMDKHDLENLKADEKSMNVILDKRTVKRNIQGLSNLSFSQGEDLIPLLKFTKLSNYQFASLIDMDGNYISKVINKNLSLTKEVKRKINKVIDSLKRGTNIRNLHFEANKRISLKKECFILRRIRKKLDLKQKDLACKVGFLPTQVGNYERGLVTLPAVKESIKRYLKSFEGYKELHGEAKEDFQNYKQKWDNVPESIIKFRFPPVRGKSLESFAEDILKKRGWTVFKNVVVADKDLEVKKEIDIYAMRDSKEMIVECKNGKMQSKWKDIGYILKEIKRKCNVDKIVYLSPFVTDYGKKELKECNIEGLNKKDLR